MAALRCGMMSKSLLNGRLGTGGGAVWCMHVYAWCTYVYMWWLSV